MAPQGAMYAFICVDASRFPEGFDDQRLALDLLEEQHVLVAPGSSLDVPYSDHFRVTLIPAPELMADVMSRMDQVLSDYELR